MSGLLIGILNMSLSASCVALIVILVRLLLRKAPKIYSYALWAVVFFRLVCPFSIQLPVSAVPVQPRTIPRHRLFESPSIQSGMRPSIMPSIPLLKAPAARKPRRAILFKSCWR